MARGSIPQWRAEAAILDRDECLGRKRIELGDLDRLVLDRAAPGDRLAFLLTSSIAGSFSGSSARPSGAVKINQSKVARKSAATP